MCPALRFGVFLYKECDPCQGFGRKLLAITAGEALLGMLLFMVGEGTVGQLYQLLPSLWHRLWRVKRTFWAYEDKRKNFRNPLLFDVGNTPSRRTIWIQARGGGELHYLNLRFVSRDDTDYDPQDLSHLIKIDRLMVFDPERQQIEAPHNPDPYGGLTIRFAKPRRMNSEDPIGIELDAIAAQPWKGFLGMKGSLGRTKRQWGWKAVEAR